MPFYPSKGSLLTKNTTLNNFDQIFAITYFKEMQLNISGMYILSISVNSNEKDFNSKCYSNPIRVAKKKTLNTNTPTANQTEQNYYELKFKTFNVFNTDEANIIVASIYNCMENFNISVSNLKLTINTTAGIRLRRSSNQTEKIVLLTFNSFDTNPVFISNLSSLNISDTLVFVSATINGVTYGEEGGESFVSSSISNSSLSIVVGCVVGGIIFIFLIVLGYIGLKKLSNKKNQVRVIQYTQEETVF